MLIEKTETKIQEQLIITQTAALKAIMPQGVIINELKGDKSGQPSQYWMGVKDADTSYAFKLNSTGYSSTISYFVSVNAYGIIEGMSILEQNETPGLGTRVQETISNKYIWNGLFRKKEIVSPWFTEQFKGINVLNPIAIEKSFGEWHKLRDDDRAMLLQKNTVTAITGATISTHAVVHGIESQAKAYFKAIKGNTL
ncbi:MAG TPA: FMN-binding protein [Chitinispirillaceae bacterium]|nr:FMN-binding protein [Chitinispirillaceae bacterium]